MSKKDELKRQDSGKKGASKYDKPQDFKGTSRKLLDDLGPYKVKLILVVVFAIGSTIFSIVGPKIMGTITNIIFEGVIAKITVGDGIDFPRILNIIYKLIGLYVISAVLAYIQGFIVTGVAQSYSYELRERISKKINRLPLSYFDEVSYGDVLSRVTNDVDTVSQTLNQSLSQIITNFVTLIGILVMMIYISIPMTLVALLIVPVSIFFVSLIVKKSQKYFMEQQNYLGEVNGHIEEVYGGHNIVKAFNAEDEVTEKFEEINQDLYQTGWKSQFLSGLMQPIMNFVGNLGYVMVSIMGGWFTIKGRMQVGDILSFIQYTRSFTQPIAQVAQVSNVLQSTVAAAERVYNFLEEDEELEVENPIDMDTVKIDGNVSFENIKFGYNKGETIINNFSQDIKKGQKVAIVGPTGAGKTTIIKLLMRFYDVDEGAILVDGHNIKDFTRHDLRSNFGMVLQDTWLYSGTIKDNIRYGRLNATDEEVYRAADAAYAHRFITTLPDGYDMEINEEADNISQGQKQLLTIARAILSDPKILILDEATSSVDTRTELLIQKAMENLMENRTSFIIAHRLSTIRDADIILVMKDGDIIEKGSHDELIAKKGFYEELYNSQFSE